MATNNPMEESKTAHRGAIFYHAYFSPELSLHMLISLRASVSSRRYVDDFNNNISGHSISRNKSLNVRGQSRQRTKS